MSLQALTWVLEQSRSAASDRCVMFSIANHCDPEGTNGWPALDTIANESNCSVATVKRSLARLRRMGEVAWQRGGGFEGSRRRSNFYWMPAMRVDRGLRATPETRAQDEPSNPGGLDKGSSRPTRAHLRTFNSSSAHPQQLTGEPLPKTLNCPEPSNRTSGARAETESEAKTWLGLIVGAWGRAEIKRHILEFAPKPLDLDDATETIEEAS